MVNPTCTWEDRAENTKGKGSQEADKANDQGWKYSLGTEMSHYVLVIAWSGMQNKEKQHEVDGVVY